LNGYHGICNVCLSVPSIVGRSGVRATLPLRYSDAEMEALQRSAAILRSAAGRLG
jgi:malate/lactate dehydrogenase